MQLLHLHLKLSRKSHTDFHEKEQGVDHFQTKTPNIYSLEEIKPQLYHQIGNINFFIFITNQ